MKTENISTLKIHKLTQAQYDRELAAGKIDESALYLTPDNMQEQIDQLSDEIDDLKEKGADLTGYATEDYVKEYAQPKGDYLTQHQDLSGYAKKATTLAGYGITDGATKKEVSQLSSEIADLKENSSGATPEQLAQIEKNKNDISQLSSEIGDLKEKEVDLSGYATETYVQNYAQPKGNYATTEQVSRDISNLSSAVAVERERINQFTTLEKGSTTGDAELIDARVDYKGTTHANVGEHIRTIGKGLDYVVDIDYSTNIVTNKYLKPDGMYVDEGSFNVIEKIPVHGFYKIEFNHVALKKDSWAIVGYGRDKKYIGQIDDNSHNWTDLNTVCFLTDDIYYVSLCYSKDCIPTITAHGIKNLIYKNAEDIEALNYKKNVDLSSYIVTKKYISKVTGSLVDDGGYNSVYKLPVHSISKLTISNLYVMGNVSIVSYDKDGNYIKNLGYKSGSALTCDFEIDEETYYISFSYTNNLTPSVVFKGLINGINALEEKSIELQNRINVLEGKTIYYFDLPVLQKGKRAGVNGEIFDTTEPYSVVPWVRVEPNCEIYLKNIYHSTTEGFRCSYYDENFNFISYVNGYSGYTTKSLIKDTTPANCKYLTVTVKDEDYQSGKITKIYSHDESLYDKDLKSDVKETLVVWVDDDGDPTSIERVKEVCDALGITATLACLGERVEQSDTLKNRLLEFEEDGLQIVYHGYAVADTPEETDIWTGENTDVRTFEKDFVKGLRALSCFQNTNYLVTTNGANHSTIRELAPKYFKCLVAVWEGNNPKESIDSPYNGRYRYNLGRLGLTDCDYETFIGKVDNFRKMNDLVILCSHCHFVNPWPEHEHARVQEKLQYIKDKGFRFVTLKEAIDYYFDIK